MTGPDLGALSTIVMGYQSQLTQMAMALLSGSAVLLFANRRKKQWIPICLTLLGGSIAALASFKGLHFVERTVNDFIKNTVVDSSLADIAECQLMLIAISTVTLGFAALTSEHS
jgi:cell division protein FtsW (lipid II flippase)